jgi:uncharacterized membrane protein YqaE (UPF0057 family)
VHAREELRAKRALPLARTIFAVHLPPGSVLVQAGGVTAGAIVALAVWFRFRPAG